jgi:hypothetical protein
VSAAGDAVSCVPATKLGAPRLRVVQRRRLGPAVPDVALADLVELLPAAFGVMVLTTGAVGVAR